MSICELLKIIFFEATYAFSVLGGILLFLIGLRNYHQNQIPLVASEVIMNGGALILGISSAKIIGKLVVPMIQLEGKSFLIMVLTGTGLVASYGLIKLGHWKKLGKFLANLMETKVFLVVFIAFYMSLLISVTYCL